MNLKKCKWCEKKFHKLAKSHIIPRAFFNYDGQLDKYLITANDYKRRRPTGSWDDSILCNQCESGLSTIDSDAANILLGNFELCCIPFGDERDRVAYQIDGRYMQAVKEFLTFTLWKASVSGLEEFRGVNLGPYEDRIRNALKLKCEIKFMPDEFSFLACKVQNPSGVMLPLQRYKHQYEGRTYYMLNVADFVFDVKVDNRQSVGMMNVFAKHPNVIFLKFAKTPRRIREAMVETVRKHEAKFSK